MLPFPVLQNITGSEPDLKFLCGKGNNDGQGFENIFQGKNNRLTMTGLFLAMLELIRSRLVWIEQARRLGPIFLRPLTDQPAEQAVQNAIFANPDTDDPPPPAPQEQIPIQEIPPKSQPEHLPAETIADNSQNTDHHFN